MCCGARWRPKCQHSSIPPPLYTALLACTVTINIFKLAKYFCEFENIWAIEISLNQCRRIEFSFYDKIFSAEDQIFLYTPPLQPGTGQQPCRAGQHSTAGPGLAQAEDWSNTSQIFLCVLSPHSAQEAAAAQLSPGHWHQQVLHA